MLYPDSKKGSKLNYKTKNKKKTNLKYKIKLKKNKFTSYSGALLSFSTQQNRFLQLIGR